MSSVAKRYRCQRAAILLLGLASMGCSARSNHPPCYPVRGRVLFKDQPVAEAMVVFHLEKREGDVPASLGYTNAQGEFQLTTFAQNDGAPAGNYMITVELRALRQVGDEAMRDGPNQLPAKYSRPETADLRFEVQPNHNEVPPLNLRS